METERYCLKIVTSYSGCLKMHKSIKIWKSKAFTKTTLSSIYKAKKKKKKRHLPHYFTKRFLNKSNNATLFRCALKFQTNGFTLVFFKKRMHYLKYILSELTFQKLFCTFTEIGFALYLRLFFPWETFLFENISY